MLSSNELKLTSSKGGTAGCIIAGRLAEADPELSILLIESGPNNYEDPAIVIPAFWLSHMDPNDKYVRTYKSNQSSRLGERELLVPTSRVLGGGSSVNTLIYSRAQRSEIDAWRTPGWSADEVLTFMNKVRTLSLGYLCTAGQGLTSLVRIIPRPRVARSPRTRRPHQHHSRILLAEAGR